MYTTSTTSIRLELVEVVLIQCNLVDNQYQQKSEVSYIFTPNKSYAYLLNVEPSNLVFLNYKQRIWIFIIRKKILKKILDKGLDASKKVVHKAGEFKGNKIADVK